MARKTSKKPLTPLSSCTSPGGRAFSESQAAPAPVPAEHPAALPAIPDEGLGLLPSDYDVDRLYAVPRDPERVFATWELSSATLARAAAGHIEIKFRFSDGEQSVEVSDSVHAGMHQYYCAVPEGMLSFTTAIGIVVGGVFEPVMTTPLTGLAVDFVRPGTPEFVRVDLAADIGRGAASRGKGMTPAGAPPLPAEALEPDLVAETERQRQFIGYMPVSGRK